MIKENETQHLNEIGAKIMGWKEEYFDRSKNMGTDDVLAYIGNDGLTLLKAAWNPATDLNHTDMVEQEMVKKGWKISVYSPSEETGQHLCIVSKRGYLISFKAEAPLGQKVLAIMKAVEKALEKRE